MAESSGEKWALATGRGLPTDAVKARLAFEDSAAAGDPLAALNHLPGNNGIQLALKAFEKAGFRADRTFDDTPFGPHLLLVRRRHHRQEPA